MNRLLNYLWLLIICFPFIGISCSKGPVKSNDNQAVVSVDSDCLSGIDIFNKAATYNLISEIKAVNAMGDQQRVDHLRTLYPKARDAWNSALFEIESSYGPDWSGVTTEYEPYDIYDDRSEESKDFFKVLTEYRYRVRSGSTYDTSLRRAVQQKSDMKKRLNAIVKSTLDDNCRRSDTRSIRELLNPIRLPQEFDDCLTTITY